MKPLIKLGEAMVIQSADIKEADMVLADPEIVERFTKIAKELKRIAPKAEDFLYFNCIMMHAAEAALLNGDGSLKKDASGKDVTARWEKTRESWKWVCSDETVRPYKNSNNDIFPEEELIKAHKRWIGRPLCLDHKSSSVDMVRGIIVDTYYDHRNKRVVALCALDKVNYPDLARKVSTGYATCVSMGTAVERAICTDCGTVARTESDFCDCMRGRRCYGEINVGLNPIELSIVVTGADPNAKIRHIIAAADSIARYCEMQEQLSKVASDEAQDIQMAEKIEQGLDRVSDLIENLKKEIKGLKENEQAEMKERESKSDTDDSSVKDSLAAQVQELSGRLEKLSARVNKLQNSHSEETKMTTKNAYFQGGGGENEPTPGKPKYNKEDAEGLRNNEDKHMVGQSNTGPVDGMHPGYESFGETEEARKKRLQRLAAEKEERHLRRQAALEKAKEGLAAKEAYFQGAGGVNEPTPGKPKYNKEDAEGVREKEDKQMVGQAPFPGVGPIDGLHPSPASADVKDELKRKQMLARASKLTAKFAKAANADGSDNLAKSRWDIYADSKLVLTATVADLVGEDKVDILYDSVATKEFARSLIAKVRSEGVEKIANQLKGTVKTAQALPAVDPAPAAEPAPMGAPAAEPVADLGGTSDPKAELPELVEKAQNTLSDISKGIDAILNEGNELADFDQMAQEGELPPSIATGVKFQGKLTKALTVGLKKAEKELTGLVAELKAAQAIYDSKNVKGADKTFIDKLASEVCSDTRDSLADSYKLMRAFAKYARGTENLVKKASQHVELMKTAQSTGTDPLEGLDSRYGDQEGSGSTYKAPAKPVAPKPVAMPAAPAMSDKEKMEKMTPEQRVAEIEKLKAMRPGRDESLVQSLVSNTAVPNNNKSTALRAPEAPRPSGQNNAEDCEPKDVADVKMGPDGSLEGTPTEVGEIMKAKEAAEFNLNTKEGRAQYRAKLAEKGLAFSDMLKTHKGGVTTELDIKPSGDLAKVETLEEQHKAMMDVATAPPRVRKAAEDIQKMVVAGRIDPTKDFPSLISQGLDKEAVSYWKSFYGEAKDGGSQFAAELVKEHVAKKMAEEKEAYKVKIARAYELTYDMVRRGQCADNRPAINSQVNELMAFSDTAFDSMKRWVERQPIAKTASVPQVGMMGVPEVTFPAPEATNSDLNAEFKKAFANKRY